MRPNTLESLATEFWNRVDRKGPADCWNWKGLIRPRYGYGHLHMKGKEVRAHRISWVLTFGRIPEGLLVLHRCDNRCCVNPEHLFLGTQTDNLRDMDSKGRRRVGIGSRQAEAKLTEDSVTYIRQRVAAGARPIDMARLFGVTDGTISSLLHRRTWRHVA